MAGERGLGPLNAPHKNPNLSLKTSAVLTRDTLGVSLDSAAEDGEGVLEDVFLGDNREQCLLIGKVAHFLPDSTSRAALVNT